LTTTKEGTEHHVHNSFLPPPLTNKDNKEHNPHDEPHNTKDNTT